MIDNSMVHVTSCGRPLLGMIGLLTMFTSAWPLRGEGGDVRDADTTTPAAYGVRWKLIVDEVNDYVAPCERIGLARGLEAVDFDRIAPFNGMRRCNVLQREDGGTKITYEGEPGFSLTGSHGNVFVEIPKHYAERGQADGHEYRFVSDKPLPGFAVDPAFVEDGRELDAIYVSAYEALVRDGKMMSISGVYPTADHTRPDYRRYAQANGTGYGILDIRTLNMLQNLFLVEYATRDSQAAVGKGWGKIMQPLRGAGLRCAIAEKGVNRFVVSDWRPSLGHCLFVGSAVQLVDYEDQHTVHVTGRTIVRVDADTPSKGYTAVYFDGEPIDTDVNMMLGGAAQKTVSVLSTPSGGGDCGEAKLYSDRASGMVPHVAQIGEQRDGGQDDAGRAPGTLARDDGPMAAEWADQGGVLPRTGPGAVADALLARPDRHGRAAGRGGSVRTGAQCRRLGPAPAAGRAGA
jgi:hypothetical protein